MTLPQLANVRLAQQDQRDLREKLVQMANLVKMARTVRMPSRLRHLRLHHQDASHAQLDHQAHQEELETEDHKV